MRKRVFKALRRGDVTMHADKHTGTRGDRRRDKADAQRRGVPQWMRRYRDRYSTAGAEE